MMQRRCYHYAKNPKIGRMAGWLPHQSIEESCEIIKSIFMQPGVFAICLKENPEPIGAISIQKYGNPEDQEGELGYWLGEPFWGSEIMVEACRALIDYAFETGYRRIWCGHFRENEQSKRVIEKCGFMHHHTNENVSWKLRNQVVTQELYVLKADDWMKLQG